MDMNNICPGCGRGCSLSEPHCDRGREYARTGVLPEKEAREGHRHHHKKRQNLLESSNYTEALIEEKLFTVLPELGHFCRFYFDGKSGQGRILRILSRDGALSQRELTEQLGIQPGSASETLGKLERAGLIERSPAEEDRRTVTVRLTDAGRQQIEIADSHRGERINELFSGLSEEEKLAYLAVSEKLYAAWRELRAEQHRHSHSGETE